MATSQISRKTLALLLLLVAAAAAALSPAAAEGDEVLALTESTFDKEVGQDRAALVEFYAPWCGHCKKLAPEYEKLAASFKKAKSVLIAKVDCDEHKSVCSKYGVSGYPTIQWFPKGSLEPKKYEGQRTAEALAEYVNSEAGDQVLSKWFGTEEKLSGFAQVFRGRRTWTIYSVLDHLWHFLGSYSVFHSYSSRRAKYSTYMHTGPGFMCGVDTASSVARDLKIHVPYYDTSQ